MNGRQNETYMTANIDWDTLKSAIKNNKCVLFLGQDFLQTNDGKTLSNILGRFLTATHAELKPIYDQDGFLPLSKRNRNKAVTKVETFFEDIASDFPDLYKTIASIPFRVVINMTPDETLIEAFKPTIPIVDYYNQNDASAQKFDPKQPFIFNFLGKLSDEDSLVLTHADFYNHLKSKFAEQSLSRLRNALLDVRCAIFMGVPYNRYFMDLIFRDLRMHEADKIEKYLLTQEDVETAQRKSFYDDEFNITFIHQSPKDFFDELIARCGASVLRTGRQASAQSSAKPGFNAFDLQSLLGDGKDQKAMENLEAFFAFEDAPALKDLSEDLILLKGRWAKNKSRLLAGLIATKEAAMEEAGIVRALQVLITETAEAYQKLKADREQ